jgi:hypothetical protein
MDKQPLGNREGYPMQLKPSQETCLRSRSDHKRWNGFLRREENAHLPGFKLSLMNQRELFFCIEEVYADFFEIFTLYLKSAISGR